MENNAPTDAGPTPDLEDNNNGSEKESPSPRIIESTTTENVEGDEGVKEEQTSPDSAVGGVTNEASDEVTIESKPPGVEDSVPSEERETSEVGEENTGDDEEKQAEKTIEEKEEADGNQGEEKPSDPRTETESEVPAAEEVEMTSESKVETESEEKPTVEEKGETKASSEPGNVPEPEIMIADNTDQEKEENAETPHGEDRDGGGNESQEEIRQDNIDTSSSVTKAEEGYSADNEATTTLASIDTGEPSNSGSLLEKDEAEGDSAQNLEDQNNLEENVKDQADGKDGEQQNVEEAPMNYEELLTKYHAAELQLDGLRDEKKDLEDKIEDLQSQIKEFHENKEQDKQKQKDGYMVQADFLARELSQTQDAEKFLKEKVAELLEQKEESEKKVRDLQLRLKRFSKDDKAKDERIAKMESELREITEEVEELESYLDEETKVKIRAKRSSTRGSTVSAENSHRKGTDMNKMNTNRSHRDPEPVQRSRTCTII